MTVARVGDADAQRIVATAALVALAPEPFALAGSGAIREHGLTKRATADVDLFSAETDPVRFAAAVDRFAVQLRGRGFTVSESRRAELFASFEVIVPGADAVEVDLGVDWREHEPVVLGVGPVLALHDAVANKVSALYGRAEARDFIDVDAIRQSGRYDDADLIATAVDRDPGFDVRMFAQQLANVTRIQHSQVREYGVSAADLELLKARLSGWAESLGRSEGA
ncbi:nucleotidyl transferase AbiEii/AbiGii toxin family protein [Curtobacterium sp. Leaf261]|uniref:nucleotidyl transferase AbiEii/AbiGii toxin family protein n=1 Tax=Curtobacterium sp. Leaf261 TaxID=1736311 RepID=UPI0006FA206C|nr:nucleotidyl transferase AbiEii/AbiGii toxin family protein [Curtobacterium sp. Leaf261]KQO63515.1 hypothetical protein ASF23_04505 [Curtobacterium sp. Leaf261]